MTKKTKWSIWQVVVVAVGTTIAGLSVYDTVTSSKLQASVDRMGQRITHLEQQSLSEGDFQSAVASSLEAMAEKRLSDQRAERFAPYQNAQNDLPEDRRIYGNPEASFTLVEYSDVECPFCKRHHGTLKELVDVSDGNINWEWKHLPLDSHNPVSARLHMAAECANEIDGNRAFWVFLEEVFAHSQGGGRGAPDVLALGQRLGLDREAFQQCIQSNRHLDRVEADIVRAESLRINSTPTTYVVNNRTGQSILLRGAVPMENFLSAIQQMQNDSTQ